MIPVVRLVEYDEKEEELILDVAWAVQHVKERKGAHITRKYDGMSLEEFHRRWIIPFYCVTKYLNVNINWDLTPDANYAAPHFIHEGHSFKVRMPKYADPYMKFDRLDLIKVELVVLCSEPPETKRTVAIHGCVSYQRFAAESELTTLPGQRDPCLIMKASQMTPIDLWEEEAKWKPHDQLGLDL